MRNTNDIAYQVTALLRKNARKNKEPRVRQATIERGLVDGAEQITFQNTNGDWFEISIRDHWMNGV